MCCHVFVSVIQIVPCMLRSLERNVCLRMRTCCKCITWCELFEVLNAAQACTRHNSCVSMGGGIASVMHRHCWFSVLGHRCDCVNVLLVLFCSGAIVVLPVPCCFVFQFRVVGPLFCPFFLAQASKSGIVFGAAFASRNQSGKSEGRLSAFTFSDLFSASESGPKFGAAFETILGDSKIS